MDIITPYAGSDSQKGNGFFEVRGLQFSIPFPKRFDFYNLIFNTLRINLTRFVV